MRGLVGTDRWWAIGFIILGTIGLDQSAVHSQAAPPSGETSAKGTQKASRPAVDPASVESINIAGRPNAKTLGDDTRLVLWQDPKEKNNIHVQAVAHGAAKTFRGTIVTMGGGVRDVEGLETLEKAKRSKKGAVKNSTSADSVQWRKDSVDFRFHTMGGKTDEITIRITPETTHLKLTFLIDGRPVHDQIFLGKAGSHPSRDIVVVPLVR